MTEIKKRKNVLYLCFHQLMGKTCNTVLISVSLKLMVGIKLISAW